MIQSTKGIVLRAIKYGETSVVASIYTEHFGIQSYMVNAVRTKAKSAKAHFFQPASILEMQVYHSQFKNLHRIKELKWSYVYQNVLSNVAKNGVALYMVELLYKCLKQPEAHKELFDFCEDALLELDTCPADVMANFPIYFSMQLAPFLGFRLRNNYSDENPIFNPADGDFTTMGTKSDEITTEISSYISYLIKANHPKDLGEIKLNQSARWLILAAMEKYYSIHIDGFGSMKTLPVLHELLL